MFAKRNLINLERVTVGSLCCLTNRLFTKLETDAPVSVMIRAFVEPFLEWILPVKSSCLPLGEV